MATIEALLNMSDDLQYRVFPFGLYIAFFVLFQLSTVILWIMLTIRWGTQVEKGILAVVAQVNGYALTLGFMLALATRQAVSNPIPRAIFIRSYISGSRQPATTDSEFPTLVRGADLSTDRDRRRRLGRRGGGYLRSRGRDVAGAAVGNGVRVRGGAGVPDLAVRAATRGGRRRQQRRGLVPPRR